MMFFFLFISQVAAPRGTLIDVQHLETAPPVLSTGQTPIWGSRMDTESPAAAASPVPAPASISVSTTVQFEAKAPVRTPPPALGSAAPQTPTQAQKTLQPVALAQLQAPISASTFTVELTMVSSVSSAASQISTPGLVSDSAHVSLSAPSQAAAPAGVSVLQPAGVHTTVPVSESASLTQHNVEATSVPGSFQQEICAEVGFNPSFLISFLLSFFPSFLFFSFCFSRFHM